MSSLAQLIHDYDLKQSNENTNHLEQLAYNDTEGLIQNVGVETTMTLIQKIIIKQMTFNKLSLLNEKNQTGKNIRTLFMKADRINMMDQKIQFLKGMYYFYKEEIDKALL